jgi:uncharacterized protein (DUF1697 family)
VWFAKFHMAMALVVFLRGVNVGGHRRFRPTVLASELRAYDVVNIGAGGTFVVRRPGRSLAKFREELVRRLPHGTEVMICDARDVVELETHNPFGAEAAGSDVVRFVSILSKTGAVKVPLPVSFPPQGDWLVKVIGSRGRFVFGMYRRDMKTISYLGKIDTLFGAPATTRNWNTMMAVIGALRQAQGSFDTSR